MFRISKVSSHASLTYTSFFRYESIWKRLFNYFKKSNITSNQVYHEDLKNTQSQSEHLPFQYKMDETKPKTMTPGMLLEAQLQEIEQQKEISEIERLRMKEIDKMLGTNTHFHEVEPNEERLNSEFVMERQALKEFAEQEDTYERLVQLDPQQKIIRPKIRNFHQFAKKAFEMRNFPKHTKESTLVHYKFEDILDHYKYLEFQVNSGMIGNNDNISENNLELKKYLDFVGQEMIYTNYSLARMQRIEDQISKEYFALMKTFNVQPLHYDDWIYYTKDPQLTSKSIFDLYRVRLKKNTQDQNLIKVTDINPINEECVLTVEEILVFLKKKFEDNEEIRLFIEGITNFKNSSIYREFSLDKEHNLMAITLNSSPCLTIFKDLKTNKFYKNYLKEVDDLVLDQKKGLFYVKSNHLNRKSYLVHYDIEKNSEVLAYEEKDLNFHLKVKKSYNRDYGFLFCEKIGGKPSNEIGIIDLNSKEISIQKTFDRKQNIFWLLKLNAEAFYFMEKGSNKINRILRNQTNQTLRLLNQNQSMQLLFSDSVQIIEEEKKIESAKQTFNREESSLTHQTYEKFLTQAFQKPENYEVFYQALDGEKIINFEVFKNYVVINLLKDGKEFFKIYNCKNRNFHTVFMPDLLYEMARVPLQNYESQYYLFTLSTYHLPTKLMCYNMALREFSLLYSETYAGLNLENHAIERVEAEARDGKKIPVTFIYHKTKVNENSVVILHSEYYHDKKMQIGYILERINKLIHFIEFSPEFTSILDRGFIYAFPHIRGSFDINEEWLEQGSGLKKLTMICDYIDTAAFILKKGISHRVFSLGVNPLGGLCAIISILREPKLFSACAIDNGIFDVLEYIDKHPNQNIMKKIFGDFEDKDIYEFIKSYSPYHLRKIALRNTLITADTDNEYAGNCRKFTAKIRENEENSEVFYKEYSSKEFEKEKFFFRTAFFTEIAFNER